MANKTRRGSASRYGPRYSAKHKKKVQKLELQKRKQECPTCKRNSLNKRGFYWECSKCGAKMAGGAFTPATTLGRIVDKILDKKPTKAEIEEILKEVESIQEKVEEPAEVKEEKSKKEKKEKKKAVEEESIEDEEVTEE